MSKTLIFVASHRRANKVADRMIGALAAHRKIELFSFDRGLVDHPVYSDANVSHTSLGPIKDGVALSRLASLARAAWILSRAKRRIKDSDTVVLVNNLELLIISWLCGLTRLPTVYDVADIHPLQLSKSVVGRFMRWLERRVLKRVQLLVVTSPWYSWQYYTRWLGITVPTLLIENKLGLSRVNRQSRPTLTLSIAWSGLLRCPTSASVLLECLQSAPKFHLSLHGSLERLGAIGLKLIEQSNCLFTGPYDLQSLGPRLAASSFVWAIDFAEGENSKWLLPYRLYESVAAGVPLIAVDGTATAEVVRRFNIGIVLPECTAQEVLQALHNCDPATYELWLTNVNELRDRALRHNEWALVFDDVSRWSEFKRVPSEVDVGIVFGPSR